MSRKDYYKDGLLYCGICNTPREWKGRLFGKEVIKPCICECEKNRLEAEAEARKKEEAFLRVKHMKQSGFPDSQMQKWTFDKDDKRDARLSRVARNYVDNFVEMKRKGKGLLLYGTVGTGKTFMSACIANALIEKGYPCLVTNFARLTNTLSGMYEGKQQYLDSLNGFDLLVIDDLASERDTEYMAEIVQNIIDARYRSGLPLIITTNLSAEELKHPADIRKQRVFSRLFEVCVPVEVKGVDRRKEKLRAEYAEMERMLGLNV